ncbi:MAG TPA: hypothetical protein VGC53_15485 [Vicinamibacteria bacterium]
MAKRKPVWPPCWEWELKPIDHAFESMEKRDFTEIDLRRMMERATGYVRDIVEGRWVIETRRNRARWHIVEPISEKEILEVVTAYELWEKKK